MIQPIPYPIFSRILNYFVEFYAFIMFIWLNYTYQQSKQQSKPMTLHLLGLDPYGSWIVIEILLVASFVCGHMVVIAMYWIKNSVLNRRAEHDIAK